MNRQKALPAPWSATLCGEVARQGQWARCAGGDGPLREGDEVAVGAQQGGSFVKWYSMTYGFRGRAPPVEQPAGGLNGNVRAITPGKDFPESVPGKALRLHGGVGAGGERRRCYRLEIIHIYLDVLRRTAAMRSASDVAATSSTTACRAWAAADDKGHVP